MTWYICQKIQMIDDGPDEFVAVIRLKGRVSFKDASKINDDLAKIFGIEMYFSDGTNNVWHSGD